MERCRLSGFLTPKSTGWLAYYSASTILLDSMRKQIGGPFKGFILVSGYISAIFNRYLLTWIKEWFLDTPRLILKHHTWAHGWFSIRNTLSQKPNLPAAILFHQCWLFIVSNQIILFAPLASADSKNTSGLAAPDFSDLNQRWVLLVITY